MISLTKLEIKTILVAIEIATDSEIALIDAHLDPYGRKPITGSSAVIRDSERRLARFRQISEKLREEK